MKKRFLFNFTPTLQHLTWGALIPSSVMGTALVAHAETFLTADQAASLIFPQAKFDRKQSALSDLQTKTIEAALGETLKSRKLIIYVGKNKECVFIDEVIGKHESITYAVGITPDGKIKQIEILEYRETYGGQIKRPEWRKQFVGKDHQSPLKLNQDIQNISGATLSSAHVTAGVRRILQTYEQIKSSL